MQNLTAPRTMEQPPTVPAFTYGTPTPEADTVESLTDNPLGYDGEPFDPAVLAWASIFAGRTT